MRRYFGFNEVPKTDPDRWLDWIESKTRRVLVLRNPIDRWKSAEVFRETGWFQHHGPKNGMDKEFWIHIHRQPFLINISKYVNFEIIPFENLSDYLPWGEGTLPSYSNNVHVRDIGKMPDDFRKELLQYRYFRENCKVISPEEWKELTP